MNLKFRILSTLAVCSTLFAAINLSGCGDIKSTNTINKSLTFIPKYKNELLKCLSPFRHQNKTWHYSQLQFFVSEIEVKNQDGQWKVWPLADNKYQGDNVALLGEYCQVNKDKSQSKQVVQGNWQLVFEHAIAPSKIGQLRFTVGVPFLLNHQNPLLQPSPLNVPNMFWVWQSGHKFFRLDMEEVNELDQKDNWQFHLGSTGCKAPSPLRAPTKPCINGNQAKITVDLKVNTQKNGFQNIEVDLASLFSDLIITKQNSCQSEPYNDSCLPLFKTIGMSEHEVKIENQVTGRAQSLFKVRKIISPISMSK